MSDTQPTKNQLCVAKSITEYLRKGKKINLYQIMMSCGYSHWTSSSPNRNLTNRASFQKLLELIPDELITNELIKNIEQDKDKGAKNNAINIFAKLKDLYPKQEAELEFGDVKITIKKRDEGG